MNYIIMMFSDETLTFLRNSTEYSEFVEDFILDTYNIKLRYFLIHRFVVTSVYAFSSDLIYNRSL